MKAFFAQKALYSSSPILPQAAFPPLPARGGAAGRRVRGFEPRIQSATAPFHQTEFVER